jgi:hypothetical protein
MPRTISKVYADSLMQGALRVVPCVRTSLGIILASAPPKPCHLPNLQLCRTCPHVSCTHSARISPADTVRHVISPGCCRRGIEETHALSY